LRWRVREVDTFGQPAVEDPTEPPDPIVGLPVRPIQEIAEGRESVVVRTFYSGNRQQFGAAALEAVAAIHES